MRKTARLACLILVLTACSSAGEASPGRETEPRELTVFSAASLTEAFTQIGEDFEAQHEGVTVRFSFGPSDGLATQINEGAPADVFASASGTWMDAVAEEEAGVTGRADFVRNRLVVITPAGNPSGITSIEDLAEPGVKLVLAAEDVPAGGYAREALANAGVAHEAESNLVSNEEDVKAVVQKVLLEEADAGIVYVTDLTAAVEPEVESIEIPEGVNVIATYPIAVIAGGEQVALGSEFVEFVLGEGQETLRSFGFMSPG